MSEVPFLTFADFQQNVVINTTINEDSGSSGVSFPNGSQGDFLYYANTGNTPIATPFPITIGHEGETFAAYFGDRL